MSKKKGEKKNIHKSQKWKNPKRLTADTTLGTGNLGGLKKKEKEKKKPENSGAFMFHHQSVWRPPEWSRIISGAM